MDLERWGSLSVDDHVHDKTRDLVANVLLYDRLVFPVMTPEQDDRRNEAHYWRTHGWDPELQQERLDLLGPLAIRKPWSQALRDQFKSRMAEIGKEQFDSQHVAKDVTRMILAAQQPELPDGVAHAHVIPAYNSLAGLARDGGLADPGAALPPQAADIAQQVLLLTRRLAVIDLPKPEESLRLAVELSKDKAFRERRHALFDWQQSKALQGVPAEAVVAHLSQLTEDYNDAVQKATGKVYWKYAFMVCGVGAGFVFGALPGAAAAASIAVARFWMFDRKPDAVNDASRPAAMFHDIEQRVGLKLKPAAA
ncbi:hypothetical protein [Rivibacter subsaxonicus]|uniref:Uncharacterized protein n=1 Tax=Rivibacter subsaxonicus TaxID=457575 RepID=A0A4Q7VCL9_9BURK|nr:hypothetical protein [Rivibacter subsaxonicus]RZT93617.1 hypothetical protein EV670_3167 [Rivibacter subsaxonicus]